MAQTPVVRTVRALRRVVAAWKASGAAVALVPTMGALHDGHIALVRAARRRADRVITSIFVNPTQFAPNEDFSKYPRTFRRDRALLTAAGCDLIYAPGVADMYPAGAVTTVALQGPAIAGLEDAVRPFHFAGVATIVAKLFTQSQADLAFFGEKDFQQLLVVRQMARDLDLPVRVIGCPTVREPDGLAMSSRNRYLSAAERARAAVLPARLLECAQRLRAGRPVAATLARTRAQLTAAGFAVDYCAARDALTLAPLARGQRSDIRLLVAARLGTTRLIDNLAV